jgi:hypothetical protein
VQTVLLVAVNYCVLVLPLVAVIDLLPNVRRVFQRAVILCGICA